MDSNVSKLKRGMISVLVANTINLIINVLTSFLLPKYLSVDSYAAIKTYNLYVAYAGVLSLGYVDGMFLKYGGIDFNELNKDDLNRNLSTFRMFQFVVVVLLLVIGIIMKDPIFLAFIGTTFPTNMSGYFRSLYQSIGEFKRYSRIMNLTTGSTFAVNMVLLFLFRLDSYLIYLVAYVAIHLAIWLWLELYLRKGTHYRFSYTLFSFAEVKENIKDGILLMLGNFSNIILTSMDRWFIKFLMNTIAFAQYSFACSMENFINVAITPLTVTLYNYFCKEKSREKVKKIRNMVTLLGSLLIACTFPAKFILEVYLDKYIEASDVMFYLFDAQLFYLIIKSVYVNLYKAYHKQRLYFTRLVTVIVVGFALNVMCYWIRPCKEAFAVGTLLSSMVWLVLCTVDFRWLKYGGNEIAFISVCAGTFLLYGNLFHAILGFVLYISTVFFASIVLMKKETIEAINIMRTYTYKMFKKQGERHG